MTGLPVKALVLRATDRPMEVETINLRPPGAGELRVAVEVSGVCHSDLSLSRGVVNFNQPLPAVLGHEACATVVELGDGVEDLEVGQRVILLYNVPCRECVFCLRGEAHLCSRGSDRGTRPYGTTSDGLDLYPGMGVGSFAEETVVARAAAVPVPDDISSDAAALLGCAVITGVGAAMNTARVTPGSAVVVMGLGGVGLSAVQGARLAGSSTIIAVDRNSGKEAAALSCGAHHFLPADENLKGAIRKLTEGVGVDYAFDCVGSSATIRLAWSLTRRGGAACIVGIGSADDMVQFSALELFYFARSLLVSYEGSVDSERDLPEFFDWSRKGDLDLAAMITGRGGLADLNDALDAQSRGEGIRTLIYPSGRS